MWVHDCWAFCYHEGDCCSEVTENDAFATGEAVKMYSVLGQMLEARVECLSLPSSTPENCFRDGQVSDMVVPN